MVSTQSLSQSSAKKQQSISSFFTKSAVAKPPNLTPKTSSNASNDISPVDDEGLFVSEGEDGINSHRATSITPKHTLDEEEPPKARKRVKQSDDHVNGQSQILESNGFHEETPASDEPLTVITANQVKAPKPSKQTSKYAFSSSPTRDAENEDGDDTRQLKERLHQKFVKKLGRPDSLVEIRRRNGLLNEETTHDDAEGEDLDGEEDENPKPAPKGKITGNKKRAGKLTPMEEQYLEIKRNRLDTVIIMEVGYKFKFFGEDARVAAKELSIVCIPGKYRYDEHVSEAHLDRFASASIPVHRLHVHVKRLVGAGHKVGVVRQLETAALKAAGDNRNTPFVRKLTNLYTKGTYIDDVEDAEAPGGPPSGGAPATGYLVGITETNAKGWGTDEKVRVGLVAVQPATGDVIHDDFEDGFMRSEVETRLLHIAPCEILIIGDLSKATNKLVQHLAGSKTNVFGDRVRIERVDKPKTMAAQGYSHVSNFYASKLKSLSAAEDEKASRTLEKVLKLPECAIICLSAMITHLSEYGLEHIFDLTKYFQSFSARSHMLLNGTTLSSLEIYQNQTDHSEKGSLFWTLDRTKTRFGQRLLRKWVGRPLLIRTELERRIAAVEELKSDQPTSSIDKIKHLLSQVRSDLEKSLIRVYYGKCTRPELLTLLQTMQRIAVEYNSVKEPCQTGFDSEIIIEAITALPTITEDIISYLDRVNPEAAKADDKYAFFREEAESEEITTHKLGIASVEQDLDAYRPVAAEKIKRKKVDYVTVAGIEYLIEVENTQLKNVPASWAKISGTKKVSRFHTPEAIRLIRERDQHKEALAASCDVAFAQLLAEISSKYQSLRDCVQALATLDCLLSLATIAGQPGYVKPEYTDETCISVEQGRHPMVEQLLLDSYVPNDVELATDRTRALLLTGPNMGGKSSFVRQVALIAIMGQIGSYVPAEDAKLGMFDAVFTRMGVFDNMMAGESTFMVELSETSDILKQATSRSMIILDELGRGTSTHDGVAIAQAVLNYVVREKKSLTLFITHYQNLSALAKGFENDELKNVHMKFTEGGDEGQEITFLYEVGDGVAHRSYGLNVARLANVPPVVLDVAAVKSKELEIKAGEKHLIHLSRSLQSTLTGHDDIQLDDLITSIEQL